MSDDEIDSLEEALDPVARRIIAFLRQSLSQRDKQIAAQTQQISAQTQQLKALTEQLSELQRMLFGRRSEKLPSIESEIRREVEADELTVDGEQMPAEKPAQDYERRRKRRQRSEPERQRKRKLKKNLPVIHERVEVEASDLPEGTCAPDFREVKCDEVVRRVEHVREHLVVIEYSLQRLASADGEHIIKATPPPGVAPGCHYGASVHAHVVTSKCADSIPIHRLSKILERAGSPVARSTLNAMFHRSAERLAGLYRCLLNEARSDKYVHADETTLRVQRKGGCLKGWIWGIMSAKVLAYAYSSSRSGDTAVELIGDSSGYLVVDGYGAYNRVSDDGEKRKRCGCWSHARRKFFNAMQTVPEAKEVLSLITKLYKVEREAATAEILGTPEHLAHRQNRSRKIVKRIQEWVDARAETYPPKSAMGKALGYASKQRKRLRRFLKDPKIPLDNNYAEGALRIIAIGRKNFLFAGDHEHAQNLAVLQTVVSTCQLHGVNPYEYIKDVLIRARGRPPEKLRELLPWNWQAANAESPAAG